MTRAERIERAAWALVEQQDALTKGMPHLNHLTEARMEALRAALAVPEEPAALAPGGVCTCGADEATEGEHAPFCRKIAVPGTSYFEPAPSSGTPDAPRCPTHPSERWQEGISCPECGGKRVWHSGLGSTTTDEHQKCLGCGKERYVDGIDA